MNNLNQTKYLQPRLASLAVGAVTSLAEKGYKPFITVPRVKEDTLSNEFELKFRNPVGKTFENPELVEQAIKRFRAKDWGVRREKSKVLIAEVKEVEVIVENNQSEEETED